MCGGSSRGRRQAYARDLGQQLASSKAINNMPLTCVPAGSASRSGGVRVDAGWVIVMLLWCTCPARQSSPAGSRQGSPASKAHQMVNGPLAPSSLLALRGSINGATLAARLHALAGHRSARAGDGPNHIFRVLLTLPCSSKRQWGGGSRGVTTSGSGSGSSVQSCSCKDSSGGWVPPGACPPFPCRGSCHIPGAACGHEAHREWTSHTHR
jgi:hypothetical protein